MGRVARTRTIQAPPADVWEVISDPYHLPRWWPKTQRVENVSDADGKGRKWTQVLETSGGRGIRADYRCVKASTGRRYVFEQILDETPFEKFLRSSRTEIKLEKKGGATDVTLATDQQLRGLSRFGGLMMRRAAKRNLKEALDGLAAVVGRDPASGSA